MPEDPATQNIHAFHAKEAAAQRSFAEFRQSIFLPLLKILEKLKISPDQLSLLGIVSVVLIPIGFVFSPIYLIVGYALNLFFDGIDGAMARHLGKASARGAYLDVVVDHVALIATVLTLQWFQIGNAFWILLYTVCYLILVVHFVLMNTRGNPPTFPVVRTKYPLFLLVVLLGYGLFEIMWLDYFFMILGIYYALMVVIYIILFRWSLPS